MEQGIGHINTTIAFLNVQTLRPGGVRQKWLTNGGVINATGSLVGFRLAPHAGPDVAQGALACPQRWGKKDLVIGRD